MSIDVIYKVLKSKVFLTFAYAYPCSKNISIFIDSIMKSIKEHTSFLYIITMSVQNLKFLLLI